jgi:hypothetical protein
MTQLSMSRGSEFLLMIAYRSESNIEHLLQRYKHRRPKSAKEPVRCRRITSVLMY